MSSDGKLSIMLEQRLDTEQKPFFIGKLKGPFTIDCEKGICFLIFTANDGEEEMQIAPMLPPKERTPK